MSAFAVLIAVWVATGFTTQTAIVRAHLWVFDVSSLLGPLQIDVRRERVVHPQHRENPHFMSYGHPCWF